MHLVYRHLFYLSINFLSGTWYLVQQAITINIYINSTWYLVCFFSYYIVPGIIDTAVDNYAVVKKKQTRYFRIFPIYKKPSHIFLQCVINGAKYFFLLASQFTWLVFSPLKAGGLRMGM